MASVSPFLIGLPLVVMLGAITVNGGTLLGSSVPYTICNANTVTQGSTCGLPANSPVLVFHCGNVLIGTCKIANTCKVPPYPAPAFCVGIPGILQTTQLPPNTDLAVPLVNAGPAASNTPNGVFFNLGDIGPAGFIGVIGVIVGLVVLAGISALGIGTGFESVHILFIGGMMIGIWLFLSAIEGFLSGSKTSVFTELNTSMISMGGAPIGTAFYVLLTFLYFVGFMGMVKRGG